MTYEEMIKLTETNNEMIEKLSLENKWIARQYMETCTATYMETCTATITVKYDTPTGLSRQQCTATIDNDGGLKDEMNSDNN